MTGLSIDLSGKSALVTGAGQGVGRAISLYLAAAGAEILVNDIDVERAESVVSEIAAQGKARSAVFDVTDWTSVRNGVDEVGPVDILVNNAGNAGPEGWKSMEPFHETEPEEWGRFIDINLYGVMHCVRAALPGMIGRPDGRIITVISDSGRTGDANLAPYAAAKAGAAGFSRCIAREVGRHGITVNCVALGTIMPHGTDPEQDLADEQAKKIVSRYVVRRRGRPEDVAGIVTYLASPDASWITGQTYPVNGGYSFAL